MYKTSTTVLIVLIALVKGGSLGASQPREKVKPQTHVYHVDIHTNATIMFGKNGFALTGPSENIRMEGCYFDEGIVITFPNKKKYVLDGARVDSDLSIVINKLDDTGYQITLTNESTGDQEEVLVV